MPYAPSLGAAVLRRTVARTHKGVLFYDWDGWIKDPVASRVGIATLADMLRPLKPELLLGVDSRGYGLAAALAGALDIGWILARKAGNTPGSPEELVRVEYGAEYGPARVVELKREEVAGKRAIAVDDVLATGGTARALAEAIVAAGGTVAGIAVLIEIEGLGGRRDSSWPVASLARVPAFDAEAVGPGAVPDTLPLPLPLSLPLPPVATPALTVGTPASARPLLLLGTPTTQQAVELAVAAMPGAVEAGTMHWRRFADGTANLSFRAEELAHRHVVLVGNLADAATAMEQVMLGGVLARQRPASLTLLHPFFPWGTMERVPKEGIVATADPMARMLSHHMPFTSSGPPNLVIGDIHALATRFNFGDDIHLHLISLMNLLEAALGAHTLRHHVDIVFPDAGAASRFRAAFPDQPVVVCSKKREGAVRSIEVIETPAGPRRPLAVIVDDMIQSGGTMVACARALRGMGYRRVIAAASHGVFPQGADLQFLPGGKHGGVFDRVLVTDSLPHVAARLAPEVFTVVPLLPTLLRNTVAGDLLNLPLAPSPPEEAPSHPRLRLRIGTHNAAKLAVVQDVADLTGMELVGVGEASGVPPQPFGREQIMAGARARGIENGIVEEEGAFWDVGCVALLESHPEAVTWTERVRIPEEHADLVRTATVAGSTVTFGQLLAERLEGASADDWHLVVHGLSRYTLLRWAALALVRRLRVLPTATTA